MQRAKRDIRMTDEEWDAFKRLLGPEWLRAKIRSEIGKEARKAKRALAVSIPRVE